MEILNRKQINKLLGKRGVFASFPCLLNKLRTETGLETFDFKQPIPLEGIPVSFVGHPKGIEIRLDQTGELTAIRYKELKEYEIIENYTENNLLKIYRVGHPELTFNFDSIDTQEITLYFESIKLAQL